MAEGSEMRGGGGWGVVGVGVLVVWVLRGLLVWAGRGGVGACVVDGCWEGHLLGMS